MEWLNCYDAKETETIHIKSPAKQPSDENGCAQRVEDKFTVGAKRPAMALANITNTLNVDSTESGKRRAIEPPGVMSKLITNVVSVVHERSAAHFLRNALLGFAWFCLFCRSWEATRCKLPWSSWRA